MPRIGRDLLAQARMLASSEPRRPKQATLRRAVSTAYYGLFHFLIEESTALLFGTGPADVPFRQLVARAFVHAKMKSVCAEFIKTNPLQLNPMLRDYWQAFGIANSPSVQLIARAFIDLQNGRHTADYDMSVSYSRKDALNAISNAEQALHDWGQLKITSPQICRLFAMLLILWPSLAGR